MPGAAFFRQAGFFVIPAFLQRDEVGALCREMFSACDEKATIVRRDGLEHLDESVRKTASSLVGKEIRDSLQSRLLQLMPQLSSHFKVTLESCESPDCLKYRPGDFFSAHTDRSINAASVVGKRLVSTVVFLNHQSEAPSENSYGGGHLSFYGVLDGPIWEKCAIPLDAEPGLLVAFRADVLHEVTPVTHGQRLTVVTWFYGPEGDSEQPGRTSS